MALCLQRNSFLRRLCRSSRKNYRQVPIINSTVCGRGRPRARISQNDRRMNYFVAARVIATYWVVINNLQICHVQRQHSAQGRDRDVDIRLEIYRCVRLLLPKSTSSSRPLSCSMFSTNEQNNAYIDMHRSINSPVSSYPRWRESHVSIETMGFSRDEIYRFNLSTELVANFRQMNLLKIIAIKDRTPRFETLLALVLDSFLRWDCTYNQIRCFDLLNGIVIPTFNHFYGMNLLSYFVR